MRPTPRPSAAQLLRGALVTALLLGAAGAAWAWPERGPRMVPAPAAVGATEPGLPRAMARVWMLADVWLELMQMPAPGALGGPDTSLGPDALVDFADGRIAFRRVFTEKEGLGPHFNNVSCASCHKSPTQGGAGAGREDAIHVRAPEWDPKDTVSARKFSVKGVALEPKGSGGQLRRTPQLYGIGRLDAIPDAALIAYADPDDKDGDGISGLLNQRHGRDGVLRPARFGHKSNESNLIRFEAGALHGEMGITNPMSRAKPRDKDGAADPEASAAYMARVDAYVRGLAPPPRGPVTAAVTAGNAVFTSLGCAGCHKPVLGPVTGAFTDLLQHDMGPKLADGLYDGKAGPSEWRTPPLWGLRFATTYLHDARTASLPEAIALHGGEASKSAAAFARSKPADRAALLAFLKSL